MSSLGVRRPRAALDGWAVFLLPLALYVATAPRSVAMEDDGLFVLAALFNGVAHPPGYPLYTLLGHLATWWPFGTPAYRVHCLSGLLGAAAVWALWWTLRALPGVSRGGAMVAALAFSASRTFWSQATVAEVYSLNAALFLAVLGLSVRYLGAAPPSSGRLPLIALLFGLGLANHWPLMVLGCSGLGIAFLAQWRRFAQDLPRALPFALLGLSPYLWMLWRSQGDPLISFYGPLNSLSDFFYMISREGYAAVDQAEAAEFTDKLGFVRFFFRELGTQFTVVGALLGGVGLVAQWQRWGRVLALSLTVSFIASGVALALLLGFNYSQFWQAIFRVYPILAYAIWALWMALGFTLAARVLSRRLARLTWRRRVVQLAGVLLVLGILSAHAPLNDRRLYGFADRYARAVLDSLPRNAQLLVHGDISFGPIAYLQIVEGLRPDVTLYNPYGLILANRLISPIRFQESRRRENLRRFVEASARPVCVVGEGMAGYGRTESWLYWCVRQGAAVTDNRYQVLDAHLRFLEQMLAERLKGDTWSSELRNLLLNKLGYMLTYVLHGDRAAGPDPKVREAYRRVLATPHGQLGALDVLVRHLDASAPPLSDLRDRLLAELAGHEGQFATKADNAALPFLRGELARQRDDKEAAMRQYLRALRIWRDRHNPAVSKLLKLRATVEADRVPAELARWLDSLPDEDR